MNQVNTAVTNPLFNPIAVGVKSLVRNISLDSDGKGAVSAWFKLADSADEAKGKAIDVLVSKGVKAYHLDRSNTDPEMVKFHDSIKDTMVSAMDSKAQKLVKADVKTLSDSDSAVRSVLVNKISTRFGNLYKALQNFEARGNVTKTKPTTNKNVLALRKLNEALAYLKDSKAPYAGLVEDCKAIRALSIFKTVQDK
jgi:translation initiation factor 2 alpha subunit (eIF-2alpha)